MDAKWHYHHNGESHGPVTSAQLRELANSGGLEKTDLVWKQGMADWLPANRIKDLFPADSDSPPIPPNLPPSLPRQKQPSAAEALHFAKTVVADVKRTYHIQRIGIIAAASVGVLATFMPWVSVPIIGTIYGTAGDGWITLCLFIPAIVLSFLGDKSTPLTDAGRWGAAIPAGIAGLIGFGKIIQFKTTMSEAVSGAGMNNPFAEVLAMTVQLRFGIFLLVFAGIAVCLAAWLLERRQPISLED